MMAEMGGWFLENSHLLLFLHVLFTWGLIWYRYQRRQDKHSLEKRKELPNGKGDYGAQDDAVKDSGVTVTTSTELSFVSDDNEETKTLRCDNVTGRLSKELKAVCDPKAILQEGSTTPEGSSSPDKRGSDASFVVYCFSSSSASLSTCTSESDIQMTSESNTDDQTASTNIITRLPKSEYKVRMEDKRTEASLKSSESSDTSVSDDEPINYSTTMKRNTVFDASYNPEEDTNWMPPIYPKRKEEENQLIKTIKKILIFKELEEEQLKTLIDAMQMKQVTKGEVVIQEGDTGDYFYVVQRGKFQAFVTNEETRQDELVQTYDGSGSFGELALMYDMPRSASVKAVTDGALWALDRATFKLIVLQASLQKTRMYKDYISRVPILQNLKPYERLRLADAMVEKRFSDKQRIIKQGDEADGMYFIVEGRVRVTVFNDQGQEELLKILNAGDYFGELALMTLEPRAANVYAEGNVKLVFLEKNSFERLLGPLMQLMHKRISSYERERRSKSESQDPMEENIENLEN